MPDEDTDSFKEFIKTEIDHQEEDQEMDEDACQGVIEGRYKD